MLDALRRQAQPIGQEVIEPSSISQTAFALFYIVVNSATGSQKESVIGVLKRHFIGSEIIGRLVWR